MSEGKDLLFNIIDSKLDELSSIEREDVFYNDIDLASLYNEIKINDEVFSSLSDDLIDYVFSENNKDDQELRTNIIKLRDLYIGKRDYNLIVDDNSENRNTYNQFVQLLETLLNNKMNGVLDLDIVLEKLKRIKNRILNNEIINEINFIRELTYQYNYVAFDDNMYKIMIFVNHHNLSSLKSQKKNAVPIDIHYIRRPKLDIEISNILEKLNVPVDRLPNYLISELKKTDVNNFKEVYALIKKNKAEDYGILHFIPKDDVLSKLVLLLYATPSSIKGVVESIRQSNGRVEISLLKVLMANVLTCFLDKNNEYYKPKYIDYINNIELLKSLKINYRALIQKTPLFLITDYEIIGYTLSYLESLGAEKRRIINKCYKTLTNNPALIIENIDILKSNQVDIIDYFENDSSYNLLKIMNLEPKLNKIINHNNLSMINVDYDLLNKLIINSVYQENRSNEGVL